jgi:hypothetical protein
MGEQEKWGQYKLWHPPIWDIFRKTAEARKSYGSCLPGIWSGRQLRAGGDKDLAYLGHEQEELRAKGVLALAYLGHAQEDSWEQDELLLLPTWDMRRKTAESRRSYGSCLPGIFAGRQLRAGGVKDLAYLGHAQEDSWEQEEIRTLPTCMGHEQEEPRLGGNMCLAYLGHAEEDSWEQEELWLLPTGHAEEDSFEKSRLLPTWDMSKKKAESRRS